MILVSHEIPKQLFPIHDAISDYPYVLAHLLMKGTEHYDEHYAEFYKQKLSESSYSILDNSCFELGQSIDSEILSELCYEYKPSHLVLPDLMSNMVGTIAAVEGFLASFKMPPNLKLIGVVQGNSIAEYYDMLEYYNDLEQVDIIAINFRRIGYEDVFMDRLDFLHEAFKYKKLKKKIHLLGCTNPAEFIKYSSQLKERIHSIDTSSPIVHGWLGNRFDPDWGWIKKKPLEILADNLNISLSYKQLADISHNVKIMRHFIHHRDF